MFPEGYIETITSKLSAGGGEDVIEKAIQATSPTTKGMRNRQVFQLARGLKVIPSLADMNPQSLISIVQRWHNLALPYIETKEFDETRPARASSGQGYRYGRCNSVSSD